MTTYRCAACGTEVEVETIKELNIVEVKPCEACIEAAEEAAEGAAEEKGYDAGYNDAMKEVEADDER